MGLVLDACVLIAAERRDLPVSRLIADLRAKGHETRVVLSAITVMELEHGWYRARSRQIANQRRRFLDTVYEAFPVLPFTREIAQAAARIDARCRRQGKIVPVADLGIGATAVHIGFSVATSNERHFRMIPGLPLVSI